MRVHVHACLDRLLEFPLWGPVEVLDHCSEDILWKWWHFSQRVCVGVWVCQQDVFTQHRLSLSWFTLCAFCSTPTPPFCFLSRTKRDPTESPPNLSTASLQTFSNVPLHYTLCPSKNNSFLLNFDQVYFCNLDCSIGLAWCAVLTGDN